jgi:hypothetical protein
MNAIFRRAGRNSRISSRNSSIVPMDSRMNGWAAPTDLANGYDNFVS